MTAALASIETIQDTARAAVLLSPLRLRMLMELREPDSASGLARKLALPRQKLNYHLRELEQAGFVELVEERKKGNCIERVVRASARSYLVDPRALGELAAHPEDEVDARDRFSSSYLLMLAGRMIREVAALREKVRGSGKKLPTLSLDAEVRFAGPESQSDFTRELVETVGRLAAKYHDESAENGRSFRVVVGAYPKITKDSRGGIS